MEEQSSKSECDYLMVIDSDEWFRTMEPLSGIINEHMKVSEHFEKLLFFAEEAVLDGSSEGGVQGGFFLAKNTDATLEILREWYALPDTDPSLRKWIEQWPREQGLFTNHMLPKYRHVVALGAAKFFGHPSSLMIRHNYLKSTGIEDVMREEVFRNVYKHLRCAWCHKYYSWWEIAESANLNFKPQPCKAEPRRMTAESVGVNVEKARAAYRKGYANKTCDQHLCYDETWPVMYH